MANYRQIHTQIWRDDWFSELTTDEKLLFIYLFSNDSSSLTGLYKISLRVIAFETGLSTEFVRDALIKFESGGRVVFRDNIIWIVHMWRYHSNASPKVKTRVESDLRLIPESPIKQAYRYYQDTGIFTTDTVLIPDGYLTVQAELNLTKLSLTELKQAEDAPAAAATARTDVVVAYEQNIGLPTPNILQAIQDDEKDFSTYWVIEAIKEAVQSEGRSYKYVHAILVRWKRDGFRSDSRRGTGPPGNGRKTKQEELDDHNKAAVAQVAENLKKEMNNARK